MCLGNELGFACTFSHFCGVDQEAKKKKRGGMLIFEIFQKRNVFLGLSSFGEVQFVVVWKIC